MEIGQKIRNARNSAGLTQEQAAEALGVSRQTVSNWENEKSFPDIVSVIRMSDLYSVSLDHLLKEEKPMKENYLDYLEESTNVVKSKERLSKVILILASLGIWAVSVAAFWLIVNRLDTTGYSLIFAFIVQPVLFFVVSFLIGRRNYFGKGKWAVPVIFGVLYMLSGYASVVQMEEGMLAKTVIWPDFVKFPIGLLISLAGLGIGLWVRRKSAQNADKK